MVMQLGARAQAATVLALVATVGALVGVMGDRLIAQRNADALPPGDTLNILSPQQPIMNGDSDFVQPSRRDPLQPRDVPPPGPRDEPPPGPRGGPPMPQLRFIEMLTERIDLTPAQRAAIDSIVAEDRERIAQITKLTRAQVDSVGRSTRMRLSALLTPAQRLEMRAIQQERMRTLSEERRDRIGEGRSGPGRAGRRGGGDTIQGL